MTNEEFLEFWNSYKWTEAKPVYYRLYHDDAGKPLFYSGQDLPDRYIDITPEQFALQDMAVQIVDGKIVKRRSTWINKLVPASSGTLCHSQDVAVVVTDQPGQYWEKKQNVVETN
jgi:hypothetical protein